MDNKINGRTPDEIKKGLDCCQTDVLKSCKACPYVNCVTCISDLNRDALAYIQQLERERDAAVEELRRTHNCNICKHHKKSGGICDGWSVCGYNIPNWQWRGPQEGKHADQ